MDVMQKQESGFRKSKKLLITTRLLLLLLLESVAFSTFLLKGQDVGDARNRESECEECRCSSCQTVNAVVVVVGIGRLLSLFFYAGGGTFEA